MLPATPLVLVTRPRLQAQSLVQACLAAGWRAQAFSPIRIEPNPAGLAQLPQAWAWADAVFFVSPSAIDVVDQRLGLDRLFRQPHLCGRRQRQTVTALQ